MVSGLLKSRIMTETTPLSLRHRTEFINNLVLFISTVPSKRKYSLLKPISSAKSIKGSSSRASRIFVTTSGVKPSAPKTISDAVFTLIAVLVG